MRKLAIVAFLVLPLGACHSLMGAQSNCAAGNQTYLAMWDCIRGAVSQNRAGDMNNPQALRYMAVGDALAEQVRAGTMTDAQAKAQLAIELERDNSAYNAARASSGPVVCNHVGNATICN